MKQKNLILMVVAVGCGLAAAVLTSRVTGKTAQVPQRAVVVAAKDLVPPAKLTADNLKDFVKTKQVNVDLITEQYFENPEELIDQTLIRPVQAGMFITKQDISKTGGLNPPPGYDSKTVKFQSENVTPFIKPTDRVDLWATGVTLTQKAVSRSIIPNMLVLAVGTEYIPNPQTAGDTQKSVITLAVTSEMTQVINMAQKAGYELQCVVYGQPDRLLENPPKWDAAEVKEWINTAKDDKQKEAPQAQPMQTTPTPQYVKVPVAVEDLKAGTELTDEVLNSKFKMADFLAAPETALTDLKPHVGQFLQKDISKEQFIAKSAVAKEPLAVRKEAVADGTPKEEPKAIEPPKPAKKKPTSDTTVRSPQGTKTFRYEQQENATWKMLGEVGPDGNVIPSSTTPAGPATTPSADKTDDAKKAEGKIS